ncbi:hypothetical protein [Bartonella raoultii]|uniref:Uncharacterized protein n=1 Tax=Bartonella raoultii TaxID=1457020 RepID=A0ABS7I6Y4_9HYPH|nr:hypothetical protein [Bartonella raoultii]MBX4335167.1 hypothetical protein [Bartonella raoultii]MBX4335255.1 hypothetical protein [Bartonella raoultii]
MLKALAYDWKLNRTTEYISRSWSFLLIFMFVLRFMFCTRHKKSRQTNSIFTDKIFLQTVKIIGRKNFVRKKILNEYWQ